MSPFKRVVMALAVILATVGVAITLTPSSAMAEPTPCGARGQTVNWGTDATIFYDQGGTYKVAQWGWYKGGQPPAGCNNLFIGRVNNAGCGNFRFVGWRSTGPNWYENWTYTCFNWRYGPLYPSNGIPWGDYFAIQQCLAGCTSSPPLAQSFWIDWS